jgi:hypothetical protein
MSRTHITFREFRTKDYAKRMAVQADYFICEPTKLVPCNMNESLYSTKLVLESTFTAGESLCVCLICLYKCLQDQNPLRLGLQVHSIVSPTQYGTSKRPKIILTDLIHSNKTYDNNKHASSNRMRHNIYRNKRDY